MNRASIPGNSVCLGSFSELLSSNLESENCLDRKKNPETARFFLIYSRIKIATFLATSVSEPGQIGNSACEVCEKYIVVLRV